MPQCRIIAPGAAATQAGDVSVKLFDSALLSRGHSFQAQRIADPLQILAG
jgi:hypothetical protein